MVLRLWEARSSALIKVLPFHSLHVKSATLQKKKEKNYVCQTTAEAREEVEPTHALFYYFNDCLVLKCSQFNFLFV